MSSDWVVTTWGELATLEYGKSLRGYQNSSGKYPVFGTNGPIGWTDEALCPFPSVIVGRKGAYRGVHFSSKPFWVIDTAFYLNPKQPFDLKWAYYYLLSQDINSLDSGSAIPSTSRVDFYGLSVTVPPPNEQKRIAEMLGLLDARKAMLNKKNRTLESIAQAIFKSWFVDFDPVHAKAAGQEPIGMDAETAALFPSEFEDSELGPIPKGWTAGTVSRLADLNPESWTRGNRPDTISYVELSSVKSNRIENVARYDYDDAPSRARRVLRDGDTIFGTVRPGNRSYAFICEPEEQLTGSTGFAVLRPKETGKAQIVYLALTRQENVERLSSLADGAAYPAVSPELILDTQVAIPPMGVMERFSYLVSPLLQAQARNRRQEKALADLRDTLLPRLISGRLRIPEAEEIVEEAVS